MSYISIGIDLIHFQSIVFFFVCFIVGWTCYYMYATFKQQSIDRIDYYLIFSILYLIQEYTQCAINTFIRMLYFNFGSNIILNTNDIIHKILLFLWICIKWLFNNWKISSSFQFKFNNISFIKFLMIKSHGTSDFYVIWKCYHMCV